MCEFQRSIHVEWLKYTEAHPEYRGDAGKYAHHKSCIERYDFTINVLKEAAEKEKARQAAIHVVNSYDQANTNHVIESTGSRGQILNEAIEDLRDLLDGETIL